MDIKLKYRAWVGEKHADIASPLTNSDIETYATEFAEWLVKNLAIPDVSVAKRKVCPNCSDLGWIYDERTGLRSICPCHY